MAWNALNNIGNSNKIVLDKLAQIEIILREKDVENNEGMSIMGGRVGKALFFLYYAKFIDKQEPYDHGLELLSSAFENINEGFNYHTHADGLAGIGSVIELLSKNDFLDADTNELLGGLDNYLYELMIHEIKNENYDFLHGAIGITFYFLLRKPGENSKKYIAEFVNELDKIAIKDEKGVRWSSEVGRENHINEYNLSLSHGLASIIVVLSKIYNQGIEREKTLVLLSGAVQYLLNQQLDNSKFYSIFPSWVREDEKPTNSRLAWCYGDLGIGIALWIAGNNTENEEWKRKAVEVILHTTNRKDAANTGVTDTGICHGTSGIAHIYNRMYNYTGEKEFKKAAEFWFNKTFDMANHKDTFSGFKAFRTEKYGGPYENFGFLEGVAGIGLTLISAISEIEPTWDEILLLS